MLFPQLTLKSLFKGDQLMSELCDLACDNPHIDLCNVKALPGTPVTDATKIFAMNWRFFPTMDPQVYFIS